MMFSHKHEATLFRTPFLWYPYITDTDREVLSAIPWLGMIDHFNSITAFASKTVVCSQRTHSTYIIGRCMSFARAEVER